MINEDAKALGKSRFSSLKQTCNAGHGVGMNFTLNDSSRGPITREEWEDMFDPDGKIKDQVQLRRDVFSRGLKAELRFDAWQTLLVDNPFGTKEQRDRDFATRLEEYIGMRRRWLEGQPYPEFGEYRCLGSYLRSIIDCHRSRHLIRIDVTRTHRELEVFATKNNPNLAAMEAVLLTYAQLCFFGGVRVVLKCVCVFCVFLHC